MFEHRTEPLLPLNRYIRRQLAWLAIALGIVGISLCGGAIGYRFTMHIKWLDAFLNAAMILTGMGPVDKAETRGAKIFAICYCLFSGVIFLTSMAIILAPALHRMLHTLHMSEEDEKS